MRRHERLPTRALISVTGPRGTFNATIADISFGGARLLGAPPEALNRSDLAILRCGSRTLQAVVRWAVDDVCGVEFLAPLEPDEIERILALGMRAA